MFFHTTAVVITRRVCGPVFLARPVLRRKGENDIPVPALKGLPNSAAAARRWSPSPSDQTGRVTFLGNCVARLRGTSTFSLVHPSPRYNGKPTLQHGRAMRLLPLTEAFTAVIVPRTGQPPKKQYNIREAHGRLR